jgi:hypothetical protein
MRALIWLAGQRFLKVVGGVRSRVPEDDVDVLCGAGAIAQAQFERDAALDDKEWGIGTSGPVENAGHDHVRHPRAHAALGHAELARRLVRTVPGRQRRAAVRQDGCGLSSP